MPSRPGGCRFGPAGFGRGPNACQNQGKNERCSGAPPGAPGPHGRCRRSGTDWWISHRRGSRSRARHGSSSVQPRLVRRRHTRSGGGESPGSRKGRGCGGNEAERRAKPLRCCSTLDEAVCCALILPAQPGKFPPAATGAPENRPEKQDGIRRTRFRLTTRAPTIHAFRKGKLGAFLRSGEHREGTHAARLPGRAADGHQEQHPPGASINRQLAAH